MDTDIDFIVVSNETALYQVLLFKPCRKYLKVLI